jgi:hypothetical protein
MSILSRSLEKVIEDIKVKSRITNHSCNCKGLHLNHFIILLYFVVHRYTSLPKDHIVRNRHVGRPDAAPELGHVERRAWAPLIAGLCPATPLSYINSLT